MAKFRKYLFLSFGLVFVLVMALTVNARSGGGLSPSTITFQTPFSEGEPEFIQLREILDVFQSENPDIEVLLLPDAPRDIDLIVRRVIANKAPDILELSLDDLNNLASRSFVIPLNDVLPAIDERLFEYVNELSRYGGRIYAAPLRARTVQLIYNERVLTQAGFLPNDPLLNNWPEMLQTCEAIQRFTSAKDCYPIAMAGRNPAEVGCLGAMLFSQTQGEILGVRTDVGGSDQRLYVAVDDDAGKRALTMLSQLGAYMPPNIENWDRRKLLGEFIAERVGMFYGTASDLSYLRANVPSLLVNTIEAPRERESASCVTTYGAVITTDAHNKAACKRLIRFLCSDTAQRLVMTGGERTGGPEFSPVMKEFAESYWYTRHPEYKPFILALKNPAQHFVDDSFDKMLRYVLAPEFYKLIRGEIDADTAAETIEIRGKAQLATYYGYVGHASETTVVGMTILAVCVFFLVFFTVGHRSKE